MLQKIKKDELILFQMMSHPIASCEILFHEFDSLGVWDKEKFGKVRPYQYPMFAWHSLLLYDKKLTKEENRKLERSLAESYNLGGRLTGKSRCGIILDVCILTIKKMFTWCVIASFDKGHVQEIMDTIIHCFESHKIFKLLHVNSIKSPIYNITFDNGCKIQSVNQNITSKKPGGQYHQKHFDLHYIEEASYLTKQVADKMFMSKAEKGVLNRWSGMTDFTKVSPMGEIFFDLSNKNKIINLPSYVNETWSDEDEAAAVKQFGGIDSPGYKVQIEGKVIEGMESVFDILRIREAYIRDAHGDAVPIKTFEVNKESFHRYKEILVLERPANASELGIYFDVGEGGAPSEYIVISKTNKLFKYIYRITTFQLSPDEEQQFVDTLIDLLQPTQLGLDFTSGCGKSMHSYLLKKYPDNKECFIKVAFNENIEIGIKTDKFGHPVKNKITGKTELEKVNTTDWSIQCLKDIFYQKKIECYQDIKFDTQMNNAIAIRNEHGKILYRVKGENHLYQAWQVFAVANWITEFKPVKAIARKKLGFGSFGK